MQENNIEKLQNRVLAALDEVKDPEIPAISVVDLGIIINVKADSDNNVKVTMTPTFSGCPALQIIQGLIRKCASAVDGVTSAEVIIDHDRRWSSNMISGKGRKVLKEFGLAPPPIFENELDVGTIENVCCPFCDSNDTVLRSPFGSTLCRSMHYCNSCRQAFEQFKPL